MLEDSITTIFQPSAGSIRPCNLCHPSDSISCGLIEEGKMIDKDLLKILACPACKGEVELKDNKIICKKCGLKYPVREGIPIMLVEEAEKPKG